jgi:hypothetical protein
MDRLHGLVASPVTAFPAGADARVPAVFARATGAYRFWWYDVQQVEGAV